MLSHAQQAAYTNAPPLNLTQSPTELMKNMYELYGTMPAVEHNFSGIDGRNLHEMTLTQVVGNRILTQETEIIRRQFSIDLYGLRLLAPMQQVNALKVRFPRMEWNPALIGLVPERGRVRSTSFTQSVVEKTLDRYGGGDHLYVLLGFDRGGV